MNDVFWVIACVLFYILGYQTCVGGWYKKAENGSLIEIKGEIYKIEKQNIAEKINE